jgi:hypothetical protein
VSRLIDGRGEFSKSLDGKNENINRIINIFNRYYRSLINEYDIIALHNAQFCYNYCL